ncbi:hypothetical protein PF010_g32827 [Phytophthora fragariae]|uniref:Uncharacterized protein n=1 Tax=Phytophthora fragariae TaxID=53985 RepID=A0A6G0JDH1_9STRA|nr:hypothetical protein PF010_g32827 [Phytophthora fragariae]
MNATKRPRTLLLASRSLPCSSSDAATTLPDAAVACRINVDQSLATPPRHERHQATTNLAAGQPQLAMLELGRRAAVACRINVDQSLATPPRHERHQATTNLAAGQPQLAMLELGRRHHAAGRRGSMQNQCRSIVSDATTP